MYMRERYVENLLREFAIKYGKSYDLDRDILIREYAQKLQVKEQDE